MSFQIKTSYFEGPLELLLSLIEERKLHVSEISLAEVTNDYLSYINLIQDELEQDNVQNFIQERSKFLVIAATLVLIKTRSLLPTIELTNEEEESIDDLTERLKIYEIIKKYGELFGNSLNKYPVMYRGNPPKEKKQPIFSPHESITTSYLVEILQEIFTALPVEKKLPEKSVKTTITLTQVMEKVEQVIQSGISFSLRDATEKYKNASTQTEQHLSQGFYI